MIGDKILKTASKIGASRSADNSGLFKTNALGIKPENKLVNKTRMRNRNI